MDSKLGRRHEILGILCFAMGVLCSLSLDTYDVRGGETNLIGPIGEALAHALAFAFGWAAWLFPFGLFMLTLGALRVRSPFSLSLHFATTSVLVLLACTLMELFLPYQAFGGHLAGGALGELLGSVLSSLLGRAGAGVVCVAALSITLILSWSVSYVGMLRRVSEFLQNHTGWLGKAVARYTKKLRQAWLEAQRQERQRRKQQKPKTARARKPKALPGEAPRLNARNSKAPAQSSVEAEEEADEEFEGDDSQLDHAAILVDDEAEEYDGDEEEFEEEDEPESEPEPEPAPKRRVEKQTPVILAPKVDAPRPVAPLPPAVDTSTRSNATPENFQLPPTNIFIAPPPSRIEIDRPTLQRNAELLVEKLAAYGVKGRVDLIQPGPVVTMYEFEPQSGTKISKIAGLSDDLAMALAAQKVRIVAPIPGKARVGFELPNEHRQTVYLRELLEDERWDRMQGALPLAFGKDIVGHPVYQDLAKMPHLLVAGATGSGKSVGLNVMLASLLMKKTPDDVRLLMIDPKVVELAVFDGIPHMLLPVVTDMKKASLALRWAVDEMERRYQLFADAGARNLATYNARVDKVRSGELSVAAFAPRRVGKVRAQGPNGEELLLNTTDEEAPDAENYEPERLPSIVLVVDEFADLMMTAAKDVEAAIARLAQKARAAGIHVILATQRPSVDVITGMIKANFPSRIGYKVSQREDSKTILGRTGAEHLLGLGDMLCLMPGTNDLQRVHSAYIGEDEVKDLCDYLRAQGTPVYDDNILKPRDDEEDGDGGGSVMVSDDPLYDRAVAIVAQAGYCSISHIQRHLSVGYNKAAKLVERMEKEGVVGPASGKAGGRREVFIEAR
ncbi:MAG TPA: DNA translocase FtsK 4TM domain-containing protein [Polyangiales bacterium]|nr:DNA translocase FtsK 4TM domain-containing protein [Polyangiales bacterium]